MYCEPIEEWKHITANKQKRQKVLDLLGAFAYLQNVIGHFKGQRQLDKNNQNIECYLQLDSCAFPIGRLDKF